MSSPSQKVGNGLLARWKRAGRGQRIAIVAITAAALVGLAQCTSDAGTRKECEKYVDATSGFGAGSVRDNMVEHCIYMHKEFGTPIR
jgi:hypothetical protein